MTFAPTRLADLQGSRRRRSTLRAVALAIMVLATGACTFAPQRYTQPEIRSNNLQPGALARGGLAILTPSTVTGQEEDRQTLALLFTKELALQRRDLRIVHLPEVISAINQAGLVDRYQRLYTDYRVTGVFDRDTLARISEATGVRYLGQLKLARFEQGAKSRLGILGLSVLQTQYAHMRVFLQIWDARSGSVVWEGIDELTISVETSRERAVTLRTIAEEAARDLAKRLP
ncbi:MAG: hypothetical protein GC151_14210 [Betaproteobacteria bacterium]|nr:hypothetical protein [Betaproteobacteria bacterium]